VAGCCNASQDAQDAWDAGDVSLASGRNADGSDSGSVFADEHEHHIRLDTNSRRNTGTWAEAAVIVRAKTLILWYTLFVNPLLAPAVLMSEVHRVWQKALEDISDSGNIEPSVASIKIVSGR